MDTPDFVNNAPQSELSKRLYGVEQKMFYHCAWCSGDRRKPIGSPGCICLRMFKNLNAGVV